MTNRHFYPRVHPRSFADACTSALCGLLLLLILLGLPIAIMHFVFDSSLIAFPLALLPVFIFTLFSVSKITVSEEGLRFSRLLGTPKFLPWTIISSIELAPQAELIWLGWFWPIFPAREMTSSLTSIGHYRISYGSKMVYFPPKDAELFLSAVSPYLSSRA